jgi:hypothetical protein
MVAATVRAMAKRAGRPRKEEGERGTTHIRAFDDIAEWVRWIVRVEGGSSAQLIDPLVRAPLKARYDRIAHLVEGIKIAEQKAEEGAKKPPRKSPGA